MIGTSLCHYRITEKLGQGGMGEVYRARDERLGRDVAIKVLPGSVADDPERMARFEREARALAALSHPNILAIFDFGKEAGVTYAVTELLEGDTLRQRLTRERLPWRKAVEITAAVADGLAAAHGKGIIHRDIKPENVFITSDGHVKVLDFGLARLQPPLAWGEATTALSDPGTAAGAVLGTVGYMAPEQVRGQAVDARSDIFALGCLLYETLAGKRAFARETAAETMTAILKDPAPEVSVSGVEATPELNRIIGHCLEKSPGERFQSASDLSFHLKSLLTGAAAARPSIGKIDERVKAEMPSVAVLPFANLSPDPEQEYFCEGMAEEIINALTKIEGLRVAARMSAFQFRGRLQDARQVGDALKVKMLLEGSVRAAGNRLRVTAQLINVEDGYHIWSERYDRQLEDVFAIQDEIASNIVNALRSKLGRQELPRIKRPTGNLEAYHLYLKGRHFWHHRQPEMQRRALEAYQQALEKDPSYALAHAGLCWIYVVMGLYGIIPPERASSAARTAGERALSLDDGYADVLIARWAIGFFFDWDWEEAERAIQRALDLEPNHVEARCFHGLLLWSMGRHEEAVKEVKRAQELDPLSTYANTLTGWALLAGRRNTEAVSELEKALDIDPDFVLALPLLAGAYVRESRYEEAISILERVVSITRRAPFWLAWLGWACGKAGRSAEALSVLDELRERTAREYVSPLYISWVLSELKDEGDAFEWLDRAFEERNPYLVFWRTPVFDSLRSEPRFEDSLRRFSPPR